MRILVSAMGMLCIFGVVASYPAKKENRRKDNSDLATQYKDMQHSAFLSARKTCSVWKAEGTESSHQMVNPDGEGTPLVVYCDMSTEPATMILEHDKMAPRSLQGPICDSLACARTGTITYFSATMDRLLELIGVANTCRQYVRYDCHNSSMANTRWMTPFDQVRAYWGGHSKGDFSEMRCSCDNYNNCTSGTGRRCNCNVDPNAVYAEWHVDDGYLTSVTRPIDSIELPVKEVGFGSFASEDNMANYTIGPLLCMDRVRGCSQPPNIDNTVNNANDLGHIEGDRVQYSCTEGYETDSSENTLTCGSDGTWKGTSLLCKRKDCGDPGSLRGTNRTMQGTKYGDTVWYWCKQAYDYELGDTNMTCRANATWSGRPTRCKAGLVAFHVRYSSEYWTNAGRVRWNVADLNEGDGYSTSTGIFTAPISGVYYTDVNLASYKSSNRIFIYYLRVNSSNRSKLYVQHYSGYYQRGSASLTVRLREGDVVDVYPNTGSSTHRYITTGIDSSFSGHLLKADDDVLVRPTPPQVI